MLVKLIVKMPDYCRECGYQCCSSKCDGVSCNLDNKQNVLCNSYPFFRLFSGIDGPFGELGMGGWEISDECQGLDINLYGKPLSELLEGFRTLLNNRSDVIELEELGVTLKVTEASLDEIEEFHSRVLYAYVSKIINR